MKCEHCNANVSIGAPAIVTLTGIVHAVCDKPFKAARNGRTHKCPECNGAGAVPDTRRPTSWRPSHKGDPEYEGHGYNGEMTAPPDHPLTFEMKNCDLCVGWGYLEREPRRVTQFVRWERG